MIQKIFGVGVETDKHVHLLISDFLVESQSQQKLTTNITFAQKTVLLKKHHSFYEHQLTQNYEKCTPITQPKTFLTLQILQQTCFWLVSDKKFALHHF